MHMTSVNAFAIAACFAASGAFAEDTPLPFAVQTIPSAGRTVAAEIVDLDGDGRAELLAIVFRGVWPDETREIHVHYQNADGALPATPSWSAPLPEDAASYDLAPLDEKPGAELLLLVRDGIDVLSLAARTPQWRTLLVASPPTVAVRPDERGLDRLRIARPELGKGRLLVPGLGEAWLLGAQGESLGQLRIGGRANYLVPPRPGPTLGENEVELYFDVPTLHVADIDGDGKRDVVATNRHAIRIFRQRADGSFPRDPDRELALRLMSLEDQVRNSGSVRCDLRDFDGDGRADLLVSHASGGLTRAMNRTRIHLNRDGNFDLANPDQVFERQGGVVADELVDLDGDGRPEWLRVFMPFGLLQIAEVFVRRTVDVRAEIRRGREGGRFEEKPSIERSFSIPFDFETLRSRGFVPTLARDWNGDGKLDLLGSADGKAIEICLGGDDGNFARCEARQPLDTGGRIRFGDLDGDGLSDFVLYDTRRPDVPVRVGVNLGNLPGTPPRIRPR
ncbi:MAG: VCBS repeat-containing protein [Proteobacteria bacterium]|nr:VCBS repeat-containing protein [Pseudomonadota bacterium]